MGREIHYTIESPRLFTAAEMQAGERVVQSANSLFRNCLGDDLLNFAYIEGLSEGAQYFNNGRGMGSTTPMDEVNALFLYACLVALSRVLPTAKIHVEDEGAEGGAIRTITPGAVLHAGWVKFQNADGTLGKRRRASCGIVAGHPINHLNEFLPIGVRKITLSSIHVLLTRADVQKLIPSIVQAINRPDPITAILSRFKTSRASSSSQPRRLGERQRSLLPGRSKQVTPLV